MTTVEEWLKRAEAFKKEMDKIGVKCRVTVELCLKRGNN